MSLTQGPQRSLCVPGKEMSLMKTSVQSHRSAWGKMVLEFLGLRKNPKLHQGWITSHSKIQYYFFVCVKEHRRSFFSSAGFSPALLFLLWCKQLQHLPALRGFLGVSQLIQTHFSLCLDSEEEILAVGFTSRKDESRKDETTPATIGGV